MRTFIVALALVAGCAADKPWLKASAGEDEFKAAKSECSARAVSAHPPDGSLTVIFAMKAAERACLMEKGWREPS